MLEVLWVTAVLPALAALATLFALPAIFGRTRGVEALRGGLAVAAGHLAGSAAIAGWPAWPPVDARSWLFVLTPVAALAGAAVACVSRSSFTRLVACCWSALVPPLLLAPRAEHAWRPRQASGVFFGVALALALVARALERTAAAVGPGSMFFGASGLALIGAPLMFFGASAMFGQLSAVLAACLASLALVAMITGGGSWWRGAVLPLATLFVLWAATGVFFAELPLSSALIALVGPVAAGALAPRMRRPGRPAARLVTIVLIHVLPACASLALAWRAYEPVGYSP